jgi:hypothetical protein
MTSKRRRCHRGSSSTEGYQPPRGSSGRRRSAVRRGAGPWVMSAQRLANHCQTGAEQGQLRNTCVNVVPFLAAGTWTQMAGCCDSVDVPLESTNKELAMDPEADAKCHRLQATGSSQGSYSLPYQPGWLHSHGRLHGISVFTGMRQACGDNRLPHNTYG